VVKLLHWSHVKQYPCDPSGVNNFDRRSVRLFGFRLKHPTCRCPLLSELANAQPQLSSCIWRERKREREREVASSLGNTSYALGLSGVNTKVFKVFKGSGLLRTRKELLDPKHQHNIQEWSGWSATEVAATPAQSPSRNSNKHKTTDMQMRSRPPVSEGALLTDSRM
jgi:hypothetical protein